MQPRLASLVSVVVGLSLLLAPLAAQASPALHVDGRFFRDADGAVVVLRGVNTAGDAKVPPFRPLVDPADLDPLVGWGMNVVRLAFNWEAYEPARGVYDESYLDYYEHVVEAASARGLYVVVDFHQDGYSRYSLGGCGEGFPAWTLPWWIGRATPDNGARCAGWGTQMIFDLVMHLSWSELYKNSNGARSRYLAMIERVAGRLHVHDAVIGYDMMNEPWGDEATEIHKLHEDAAAALRHADPSAILFVSPHALISAGGKSKLTQPSFGNFVFSPHYYDGAVITFKSWLGTSPDAAFANMRSVADAWGVPLFVGEFGANAQTLNGAAYVAANYDALDAALASGTQWVFTPGWTPAGKDGWNDEDMSISDGAGAPRANFVARPYPRRVAGTPTAFHAVASTPLAAGSVELTWDNDPATGATELYVPAQQLFGSPTMTLTVTGAQLDCDVVGALVTCWAPVGGPMRVRVTP